MIRRAMLGACLLSLVVLATVGCQQPVKETAMTGPAERPIELDRLDMWTGHWHTASEMRLAGSEKVETFTSDDEWRWACDRRVLINEWTGKAGEENSEGIGLWTWDSLAGKYTIWQGESTGTIVTGTATYDADDNAWHLKGMVKDPNAGKTRVFKATATVTDANTIKFVGTSWHDAWKLKKRGDFSATMRRK